MFSTDDMQAMRGAAAVDADGAKVGTVNDVYADDASGQPAWATVASGLFGLKMHFVPLVGARLDGRRLVLPYAKEAVLSAPAVAEDEHLSAEEESVLYAHYGVERPAPVAAGAPAELAPAADPAVPSDAAAPVAQPDQVVEAPAAGQVTAPDDAALREAVTATEVAHQAAAKADPIGDGSYAGDVTKASLVDTADLEAADHAAAPAPVASPTLNEPLFHSDGPADDAETGAALPEGITAAEVAASDRAKEEAAQAAETRWAVAHGKPVEDAEDNL